MANEPEKPQMNPNWHCLMCGLEPHQPATKCPICSGPLVRYVPCDKAKS